ncbi:MAG: GNAT family N-acetyltransferase [Candidatus Tectomicrobia bacterium]
MEAQIRPARPDEMDQLGVIGAYVYAGRYGDTTDNMVSQSTLPDWTLCAFVDGRMVTSLATIPFTARFNGMAAKLGGISAVGTSCRNIAAKDLYAASCSKPSPTCGIVAST